MVEIFENVVFFEDDNTGGKPSFIDPRQCPLKKLRRKTLASAVQKEFSMLAGDVVVAVDGMSIVGAAWLRQMSSIPPDRS
ncbi:hypothetical protein K9B32_13400 [Rhizobium sp. 3T7]|uniref:hypothetical protein n=1 Tax=Rhizobium sp. 3T7 TaxID=2874922 RepID=UPI001CCAFBEF|nr:hypothetical protein [Rhizobium sp. 3T7]MBZ9791110.1 hypothetical protein [Rhizobium sp. 3T7]